MNERTVDKVVRILVNGGVVVVAMGIVTVATDIIVVVGVASDETVILVVRGRRTLRWQWQSGHWCF